MKAVKKILLITSLICGISSINSPAIFAAEMEVDVGIEFTDIEKELPITSEPPAPKQPIIKLPQTGETLSKSSAFAGGSLIVGAGFIWWKRRKEVAAK